MKEFFRNISQDKILKQTGLFSGAVIFINFLLIALYYSSLPPFIPLFNQMPWGEERITKTVWIFLIPLFALIILIMNLLFGNYIYKKIPLIARLCAMTSFLIAVLALIFIIRTISLAL